MAVGACHPMGTGLGWNGVKELFSMLQSAKGYQVLGFPATKCMLMLSPLAVGTCRPMKNSLGRDGVKELVKVVVSAKDDKVLGFHMVGSEASEIMQVCPHALACSFSDETVTSIRMK